MNQNKMHKTSMKEYIKKAMELDKKIIILDKKTIDREYAYQINSLEKSNHK